MSSFPFEAQRQYRQYFREIENHHFNQLTAKSSQQLEKYAKRQELAQVKQAEAAFNLLEAQGEANCISRENKEVISRGFNDVIHVLENLTEDVAQTTEAVNTLSDIVAHGLQRLFQQMLQQQQTQDEILHTVRRPYGTKVLELRQKADEVLTLGANSEGRERDDNFKHAMRLLRKTVENPIGEGDYITRFQIGWLLWIHEEKPAEAEEEFYHSQRLSAATKNVWYSNALRHMAEMQHLQGKHDEACTTIQKALSIERDYNLLFDAARYAARADRRDDYIKLLEECIDLQPLTWHKMDGETDFTATQANTAALFQLKDRLLQRERAEIRQNLSQWQHLLDLRKQVDHKAELTIGLPPILTYQSFEIKKMGKDLDDTDYVKLLAFRAKLREAIELLEKTVKQTLDSQFTAVLSEERETQAELNSTLQRIERSLAELRQQKEAAESYVPRARDRVALPETPDVVAKKKEESKKEGLDEKIQGCGCLVIVILLVMGNIFDRLRKAGNSTDDAMSTVCGLCIVGFIIWIIAKAMAPFIALERWRSTCDELKDKAEAEAKQRSAVINAEYPEKLKDIEATRRTKIPQLENALSETRARRIRIEEAIELFRTTSKPSQTSAGS